MSPVAVRTVGEPGFALSGASYRADAGHQRLHPLAPLSAFGPAPGDRVGDGEEKFVLGTLMLVPKDVAAPSLTRDLDEALLVPPQQRIILFEHEHAVASNGDIGDHGTEARFADVEFTATRMSGVVDRRGRTRGPMVLIIAPRRASLSFFICRRR